MGKPCSHLGRKTSAKGSNLQKFNCCAYKIFQALTTGPDCHKKAPGTSLTYVNNSRGMQRGNSARLVCMQGLLGSQKQPDALRGSRGDSEREHPTPGQHSPARCSLPTQDVATSKKFPARFASASLTKKFLVLRLRTGPPRSVNTPGERSRSRILKYGF